VHYLIQKEDPHLLQGPLCGVVVCRHGGVVAACGGVVVCRDGGVVAACGGVVHAWQWAGGA
jgi:hypothetical protein